MIAVLCCGSDWWQYGRCEHFSGQIILFFHHFNFQYIVGIRLALWYPSVKEIKIHPHPNQLKSHPRLNSAAGCQNQCQNQHQNQRHQPNKLFLFTVGLVDKLMGFVVKLLSHHIKLLGLVHFDRMFSLAKLFWLLIVRIVRGGFTRFFA